MQSHDDLRGRLASVLTPPLPVIAGLDPTGVNFVLVVACGGCFNSTMALDVLDEDAWSSLLQRCAQATELEASARQHHALQRRREVKRAQDLLRLALAYGPGGLSLRQTAAWAELMPLARLSAVAVMKRLCRGADWLGRLAGALLARRAGAVTSGARPIRLIDGMLIRGPGRDTPAWRLHVAYDPCAPGLTQVELTPAREGERIERARVLAGEIRIADRGFAIRPVRALMDGPGDDVLRVGWRRRAGASTSSPFWTRSASAAWARPPFWSAGRGASATSARFRRAWSRCACPRRRPSGPAGGC